MEFQIDLSDLKESTVRRLLMNAIRTESARAKPLHKRKDAPAATDDDSTEAADEENAKLVQLAEETNGKPAPVEMDAEDMSDESMDALKPKKKVSGKTRKA